MNPLRAITCLSGLFDPRRVGHLGQEEDSREKAMRWCAPASASDSGTAGERRGSGHTESQSSLVRFGGAGFETGFLCVDLDVLELSLW